MKLLVPAIRQGIFPFLLGALFLGCPVCFVAWRWSHSLFNGIVYVGGTEPGTAEWIKFIYPYRLVDPDALPNPDNYPLEILWRQTEYSARLTLLFWVWVALVFVAAAFLSLRHFSHRRRHNSNFNSERIDELSRNA